MYYACSETLHVFLVSITLLKLIVRFIVDACRTLMVFRRVAISHHHHFIIWPSGRVYIQLSLRYRFHRHFHCQLNSENADMLA